MSIATIYFDRRRSHLLPRIFYANVVDIPGIIRRALSTLWRAQ